MEIENKLIKIIKQVFDTNIDIFEDRKLTFNQYENYDSILHMKLFLYVDKEFQISLSEKDIFNSNNFEKLLKAVKKNIEK